MYYRRLLSPFICVSSQGKMMQDQLGNQPPFTENTPVAPQGPVFASQSQPPS